MSPRARFLAYLLIIPLLGATQAAADDGKIAFNTHCRTCHSIRPGDNRLGPSMFGIFGSPAGQVRGYAGYSGALAGLTWNEETLDRFLANPASVATSTNMIFPPVGDVATRRLIIGYLQTLGTP